VNNKRFSYSECIWYFNHLKSKFKIGKTVKYRLIGNGHNPTVWGYDRHRRGKVIEWIQCENPYYLYKVKLRDTKNKIIVTVHPDLIEKI